jgi:hypothetical protein
MLVSFLVMMAAIGWASWNKEYCVVRQWRSGSQPHESTKVGVYIFHARVAWTVYQASHPRLFDVSRTDEEDDSGWCVGSVNDMPMTVEFKEPSFWGFDLYSKSGEIKVGRYALAVNYFTTGIPLWLLGLPVVMLLVSMLWKVRRASGNGSFPVLSPSS